MKIVYLYTALTTVGGADRIIIQKANYLADVMGHEVYIVTDSQAGRAVVFPLSSKVRHIDLGINFDRQYRHGLLLRSLYYFTLMFVYRRKLGRLLERLKADIVISTLGRDLDFLTQLKDGSRKVGEAHTTRMNLRKTQDLLEGGFVHRMAGKWLRRKIDATVKQLDTFVVLNEHEKKEWAAVRPTVIIPNSLPFYPTVPSTLSAPRAICVGRLEWEKGIDRLIEVWRSVHDTHPDWVLDIYGQGMLQHELQQKILAENAETYIHLKGSSPDIMYEYLNCSLLVLTSRYEGFPMALLEAMACGVPCVTYDCPFGPRSMIENMNNGILVKEGDKKEMVNQINHLIENKESRMRMGTAARTYVLPYSQKNIMDKWDVLFKNCLRIES
ncbi:glycosyltransferase family 4 protein [Phocaeicola faecalis]|uniref:glycosyltransferase family 4 protein n=1 Tax=Phocaeicola faecalis TaxID=2786956 RepID=UPI001F1AC3F8|nr:glycosyltransferase family 4 protein [Phocaeicola faecalis]